MSITAEEAKAFIVDILSREFDFEFDPSKPKKYAEEMMALIRLKDAMTCIVPGDFHAAVSSTLSVSTASEKGKIPPRGKKVIEPRSRPHPHPAKSGSASASASGSGSKPKSEKKETPDEVCGKCGKVVCRHPECAGKLEPYSGLSEDQLTAYNASRCKWCHCNHPSGKQVPPFVPRRVCSFHLSGGCKNGNRCKFLHENACIPANAGLCPWGRECAYEECRLIHPDEENVPFRRFGGEFVYVNLDEEFSPHPSVVTPVAVTPVPVTPVI